MTKFLLCTVLLFAPFTHTMNHDSRPEVVMVMGTILFAAGLYIAYNPRPRTEAEGLADGIFATITSGAGVWTVMNAHKIITKFDEGR